MYSRIECQRINAPSLHVQSGTPLLDLISEIAAPDATGIGAADRLVAVRGEDVGVSSRRVHPALRSSGALAVEAWQIRALAQPATDEDVVEIIRAAGSKHLAEGAVEELVHHLAVAVLGCLERIGFEFGALGELAETELDTVFVDNGHVAGAGNDRLRGCFDNSRLGCFNHNGGGSGSGSHLNDYRSGGDGGGSWLFGNGRRRRRCWGWCRLASNDGFISSVDDGLVDDVALLVAAMPSVGCRESGAHEGEEGNDLGGVHFDLVLSLVLGMCDWGFWICRCSD